MNYKIKFHADISYPKGRIIGKEGDIVLSTTESIESLKDDSSLASTLQICLQKQMKTGVVFNLNILAIDKNV
jgi:hypothetical protein